MLRTCCVLTLALSACGGPTPPPIERPVVTDGGFFADFTAPSSTGGANTFLVTVTGEGTAVDGVAFPPAATDGTPYLLDGWELTFEHVLVTVASVRLNENPDTSPFDQSKVGALVAEAPGPWAVDLAKGGPLTSKEQNGRAVALTQLLTQNQKTGNPAFDPTARYAMSYSLATAASGPWNVNLDDAAQAAYRQMAQNGWSVWLSGTAVWKGDQGAPACRSTDPSYDFGRLPRAVKFAFGFAAPVDFLNCLNPELQPADSRGVQSSTSTQTIAQLTFHLDHPFWESLQEDAPLRFDALAALRSVDAGAGPALAELTQADLSFDPLAPRDAQGRAIPWRTCGPLQAGERTTGSVSYDPVNVPVSPLGGASGLANFGDYAKYNLSTFGHLNNDGLCFPARQYPSPP